MPEKNKPQQQNEQSTEESKRHAARTEGTNRDLDETGGSRNQGHGHPREERTGSARAGRTG